MCSLMDIRIQDINKLLKELQGELSDALWDGDQNKAKRLEKEIDHQVSKHTGKIDGRIR